MSLGLNEYLDLLDQTGRQIRSDKRGPIRPGLQPILDRLCVNAGGWVDTVTSHYDRVGRRQH